MFHLNINYKRRVIINNMSDLHTYIHIYYLSNWQKSTFYSEHIPCGCFTLWRQRFEASTHTHPPSTPSLSLSLYLSHPVFLVTCDFMTGKIKTKVKLESIKSSPRQRRKKRNKAHERNGKGRRNESDILFGSCIKRTTMICNYGLTKTNYVIML